jgi:hypothetical protein
MVSEAGWRRILRVGAGIFFAIAATLVVVVIPPMRTDTFPQATPDRAIPAFIVIAILHVLLGGALLAAVSPRLRGVTGRLLLGAMGLLGLLFGLALQDAAAAYAGHGPGMLVATVALFACVGGDLIAGALALAAAFLRGRNLARADNSASILYS